MDLSTARRYLGVELWQRLSEMALPISTKQLSKANRTARICEKESPEEHVSATEAERIFRISYAPFWSIEMHNLGPLSRNAYVV